MWLDTYRTMCLSPQPDFRRVLVDVRAMQLARIGLRRELINNAVGRLAWVPFGAVRSRPSRRVAFQGCANSRLSPNHLSHRPNRYPLRHHKNSSTPSSVWTETPRAALCWTTCAAPSLRFSRLNIEVTSTSRRERFSSLRRSGH
jgi:hypothetical protein